MTENDVPSLLRGDLCYVGFSTESEGLQGAIVPADEGDDVHMLKLAIEIMHGAEITILFLIYGVSHEAAALINQEAERLQGATTRERLLMVLQTRLN